MTTTTPTPLTIIKTDVQFEYDIWYPPGKSSEEDVKGFVIGNVTNVFRDVLFNEPPLLEFVTYFGLDLSTTEDPYVEIDSTATGMFGC
jgi:hypothetical protein